MSGSRPLEAAIHLFLMPLRQKIKNGPIELLLRKCFRKEHQPAVYELIDVLPIICTEWEAANPGQAQPPPIVKAEDVLENAIHTVLGGWGVKNSKTLGVTIPFLFPLAVDERSYPSANLAVGYILKISKPANLPQGYRWLLINHQLWDRVRMPSASGIGFVEMVESAISHLDLEHCRGITPPG